MNIKRSGLVFLALIAMVGFVPIGVQTAWASEKPLVISVQDSSGKASGSINVSWKSNGDSAPTIIASRVCGNVVDGPGKVAPTCSDEKKVPKGTTDSLKETVPPKFATAWVELKVENEDSTTWEKSSPITVKEFTGWGFLSRNRGVAHYVKGKAEKGWFTADGQRYYADNKGVVQARAWVKDADKDYYLNPDGSMAKGWVADGETWYYLDDKGAMQKGWLEKDGSWYYLDPVTGAMAAGWTADNNTWYLFNEKGIMQTGWQEKDGLTYYLGTDGKMTTSDTTIYGTKNSFASSGEWLGEQQPEQVEQPEQANAPTYFKNCTEARAAGYRAFGPENPAYSRKLDRDGDGIACE